MFLIFEISLLILVLFLGIAPHVLWIRWMLLAFRRRHAVGRVISILSYLLFLVPFWVLLNGGNRYYGRSAAAEQVEVYILIGMDLLSILLPVGYFYARWVYSAYREQQRKAVYLRLSYLLFIPLFGFAVHILNELGQRGEIGQNLGISLPFWGTKMTEFTETISSFRGEGDINATLALDEDVLAELQKQIRQTAYYDSNRLELYGADSLGWIKSDTLLYWRVREHLEARRLTGLWAYDEEKGIYEFYEPSLSDIPNASLLFKETYILSAELNLKNKTLSYKRWQF